MLVQLMLFLFSAGLAVAALGLFYRLLRLKRSLAPLKRLARKDPLAGEIARWIGRGIDATLVLDTGSKGLAEVEVQFREVQDPYRNLADLLRLLEKSLAATRFAEVNQVIKSIFQFEATLGVPFSDLAKSLSLLETRLKLDSSLARPVARIEVVAPGTMLDPKKMMPVTSGTTVKQPLGIVALDGDGKVLGKARVICQ